MPFEECAASSILSPRRNRIQRCMGDPHRLDNLWVFARLKSLDLVLFKSRHDIKNRVSKEYSEAGEPIIRLRQGTNSCWVDTMLVALRMVGACRMSADSVQLEDAKCGSAIFALLVQDWSALSEDELSAMRTRIQTTVLQELGSGPGGESHPSQLFDRIASHLPSLSFHTAKLRICTSCSFRNVDQRARTDLISSLVLYDHSSRSVPISTQTIPELVNAEFQEHEQTHQGKCQKCRKCGKDLSPGFRRIIVDRAPHILTVNLDAQDGACKPQLGDASALMQGFDLIYQTYKGGEHTVLYQLAVLIYCVDNCHWVTAVKVKTGIDNKMEWILVDGTQPCRKMHEGAIQKIIKSGKTAIMMFKRVYVQVDRKGFLS